MLRILLAAIAVLIGMAMVPRLPAQQPVRGSATQYPFPAGPYLDPTWYQLQPPPVHRRPAPPLRLPDSLSPTSGLLSSSSSSAAATAATEAPQPRREFRSFAPPRLLPVPSQPAPIQPRFADRAEDSARGSIGDYVGPRHRTRIRLAAPSAPEPTRGETRQPAPARIAPTPIRSSAEPVTRDLATRNESGLDSTTTYAPSSERPSRQIRTRPDSSTAPVRRLRAGGKPTPLQLPTDELIRRERLTPSRPHRHIGPPRRSSSPPSGSSRSGASRSGEGSRDSEPNSRDRVARAASVLPTVEPRVTPRTESLVESPPEPSSVATTTLDDPEASASDNATTVETNPSTTRDEPAPLLRISPRTAAPDSPEPDSLEMVQLRRELRETLAYYFQRPENAATRSPWGVMHALLPFGVDAELIVDGRRVSALGWLCVNGTCWGQQLLYLDGRQLQTRVGPGVQGHDGQFLAMLAQSKVKRDFALQVGGRSLTVDDLVRYEMATCAPNSELTFKLIGLSHYLSDDPEWIGADGEVWNLSRVIDEELAQPLHGEACGGTHRLMGLAYCVNRRRKREQPIDGAWLRAERFVQEQLAYVQSLRNPDGSYSTDWLVRRGADPDIDRRMQTTGHVLEWLVFVLPQDELTKPEMVESITYLKALMSEHRDRDWAVGPKGHALRALALYDERVFGGQPGRRKTQLPLDR